MAGNKLHSPFLDPSSGSAEAAGKIALILSKAIDHKGEASLVVCGGSSPLEIFRDLCKLPLDWPKITITLVDDRLVDEHHKDSNIHLIRTHLLKDQAAKAVFIPLLHLQPEKHMPFDVVLLGIGSDGHFASLFPDMVGDAASFDPDNAPLILKTGPQGMPRHSRLTMNLAMLTNCSALMLIIKGAEKKAVLMKALAQREAQRETQREINDNMPVTLLLSQEKKPVTILYL